MPEEARQMLINMKEDISLGNLIIFDPLTIFTIVSTICFFVMRHKGKEDW